SRATAHRTGERGKDYRPRIGTAYVHTVIDDHSRGAYAEICADEKAATAIGVLRRATAWFADRGVVVERVLSDNGSCYRARKWRDACAELGIKHKRTRPYRPQTNGKIERFHRTLGDGWAYARFYDSTEARNSRLPSWLHFYNHHRAHSALGGQPPVTRLTNLPGHHKRDTEPLRRSGRGPAVDDDTPSQAQPSRGRQSRFSVGHEDLRCGCGCLVASTLH